MAKQIRIAEVQDELRYRAPALEKGLDILELLARHPLPMTSSQIAAKLGRSVSELFRMMLMLEFRGYITQVADGYALSNKLFTLGIAQGSTKNLLEVALPVMKSLSQELGQSCHLVIPSGDQIVVIARQESPMDLGFSVRAGYRRRMLDTNSGALFYGAASPDAREKLLAHFKATPEELRYFQSRVDMGRRQGYIRLPSDFVEGVVDFCMPVITRHQAVAVLVVPFIHIKAQVLSEEKILAALRQATAKISQDFVD